MMDEDILGALRALAGKNGHVTAHGPDVKLEVQPTSPRVAKLGVTVAEAIEALRTSAS